jgi:hypothetical protein
LVTIRLADIRIEYIDYFVCPLNRLKKLHRHRPQIEKVGTDGSQRGNQRFPWQGTAGSQTLKLAVPNLGTNGLPLQRTSVSYRLELMVPNVGTKGYHGKELPIPRP